MFWSEQGVHAGPCIQHRPVNTNILQHAPFVQNGFFKMACKRNLNLRCVLISDPSTLGAWVQNTSRIQNKEVYATLCLQAKTGPCTVARCCQA